MKNGRVIGETPQLQQPAEHWRMFVAVAVPEVVKKALEEVRDELREAFPEGAVRWTRREQLHLTLKFLGNVESAKVTELSAALEHECSAFPPLRLRAERLGGFPSLDSPQVLWVAVTETRDQLLPLQRRVETAVRNFSLETEEPRFTGHITLGRCQRVRKDGLVRLSLLAKAMSNRVFGAWTADRVELLRSQASSQGPHYSTIAAVRLEKNQ